MSNKMLRTYLFAPATRPERFDKAAHAGAGAVIVDLEDAVEPARKSDARASLSREFPALALTARSRGVQLLVRINSHGTPWYDADLEACAKLELDGVVIPKAEQAGEIARIASIEPRWSLHLLMETAAGFAHLDALAHSPNVKRLMLGTVDLALDIGANDIGEPLHYYRTQILLHTRLAGLLPAVDGVCTNLDDDAALDDEVRRARAFGFGAKLCVHPKQIAAVGAGLGPSPQEVKWATRVCEVASSGAAVAVDGKLVDAPVLAQARRILEAADHV
ncbi:HpcH/HpaI aldolase/citrate lyase family protein [Paraburkholderia sp. BCC1886]|uniref:HpcH/HpaI aldolase/citrate lyase family protein n=1 Tax=Paraburkholderia sp. BCC1886 TaxID=2562670 RepID=UPI0011837AA5|nr:CoA ester lyase [Paraburkholderia sp. BCC1886]